MVSNKRVMGACRAGLVVIALAVAQANQRSAAAPPAAVHPYDFAYRISGDRAARPVQVFDDGAARTFFQFAPGATVPLILVGRGPEMVVPDAEGQYHVVPGRHRVYTLVLAGYAARVEHATLPPDKGDPPASALPPAPDSVPMAMPARTADRTLSSYASPIRGDVIEWAEPDRQVEHDIVFLRGGVKLSPQARTLLNAVSKQMGPEARVQVRVSGPRARAPLALKRIEQVCRTLIDSGIAARHIEVGGQANAADARWRTASQVTVQWSAPAITLPMPQATSATDTAVAVSGRPLNHNFDILAADRTVAVTLNRWARQSGYRLEWNAGINAPIEGELTLDTHSFTEAAGRVIAGLRASGYPLQMEIPSDRVVRVIHKN